jgi:hypothetical protein
MSTIIKFNPVRAVDGNGEPVPGAQARFFVSGTTTPITVFQDAAQTTPHPSPLVADAAGVFPLVYRAGTALKVEVRTPAGVILPGFPIDPAFAVDTAGVGAIGVGFNPTAEIPVTNTQAAIERVQLNITAPVAAVGIGVTGNAPTLPNVNATNTASGFYRFTGTATGDLPLGFSSETGIVYFLRETSDTGWQFAARKDVDGLWFRRLLAGTWQTWRRVIDGSMAADQATWNAGTDTVERPVSPAKVKAAVEHRAPLAMADLAFGDVGTLAFCWHATRIVAGDTYSGANLRVGGWWSGSSAITAPGSTNAHDLQVTTQSLTGTWRALSSSDSINRPNQWGLFIRIS